MLPILLIGLLVSAAVFPVLIWWLWYTASHTGKLLRKIPGPSPLPIVGNVHQILRYDDHLGLLQEKWVKTYGDIYKIFVTPSVGIFVSTPEAIETIVNNSQLSDKGLEYQLLHDWLGFGLLTSSGSKWKSRRRMLTPAFHFSIMEDFFETFNEQSAVLCEKINNLCSSKGKIEINVEEFTSLCTLDIICETAMGCQVNAQTRESEYVKAVHNMSKMLMMRQLSLLGRIDFIYKFTKSGKEYHKTLKTLLDFTEKVIDKRQKEFQSAEGDDALCDDGIKKRRPFLDLLLEGSANGSALSKRDLSDEVNTFMFEGHDTTAMTLNWFLYCMAANPEHQERVWQELNTVFDGSERSCERQDLPELKYLECCIKETLRLYPAVPVISREIKEQFNIGEYQLPVGCDVVLPIYALHRNPRVFPNPEVFDPERFTPEHSRGRHPYAFIPFSAGSRNCIGQRFAMTEEKVVLSSLLRRFKFELSPTAPKPKPNIELTLKSTNGIHLLVSRR